MPFNPFRFQYLLCPIAIGWHKVVGGPQHGQEWKTLYVFGIRLAAWVSN